MWLWFWNYEPLIIHCQKASSLRDFAMHVFSLDWVMPYTLESLLEQWNNWHGNVYTARLKCAFAGAILDNIWYVRNNITFNNETCPNTELMIEKIVEKVILWIYKENDTAMLSFADLATKCKMSYLGRWPARMMQRWSGRTNSRTNIIGNNMSYCSN